MPIAGGQIVILAFSDEDIVHVHLGSPPFVPGARVTAYRGYLRNNATNSVRKLKCVWTGRVALFASLSGEQSPHYGYTDHPKNVRSDKNRAKCVVKLGGCFLLCEGGLDD